MRYLSILPASLRSKPKLIWGLGIAAVLAACLSLMGLLAARRALDPISPRLVAMSAPSPQSRPCAAGAGSARNGPGLRFRAEWVIQGDVIPVLSRYMAEGWQPINHMTTNVDLVPIQPQSLPLGLADLQIYRGISLSYTEQNNTRMLSSTTVVLCLR